MEAASTPQHGRPRGARQRRRQLSVCQFCQRSFSRLEHLQRHLRIHTNDKPFSCCICLKSFGRSDLMARHKRLVHSSHQVAQVERVDSQEEHSPSRPTLPSQGCSNHSAQDRGPVSWTDNLHLSSQAINEEAGLLSPTHAHYLCNRNSETTTHPCGQSTGSKCANSAGNLVPFTELESIDDPMQDFAVFLESIGLSESWEPDVIPSVEPMPLLTNSFMISPRPLSHNVVDQALSTETHSEQRLVADEVPFSNFGSRLPSLQPESHDQPTGIQSLNSTIKPQSIYKINTENYESFARKLQNFKQILPLGFVPPSKYALSRFLNGFIDGLNEHLPFIHTPTLSIGTCCPALILALAACGSHYRFENNRAPELFYAARAILLNIIEANLKAPASAPSHAFPKQVTETSMNILEGSGIEPDGQMDTIQTLLLLTIFATWGKDGAILRELITLQGTLASMVRAHGLVETDPPFQITSDSDELNWELWVKKECDRRTKFVVYCFLNLHCIMYNTPPLILNSDLRLDMPCSGQLWAASSASEWRLAYDSTSDPKISFQTSFESLFNRTEHSFTNAMSSTALGNHILMHAIFQQLYFAHQLCLYPILKQGLQLNDVIRLEDVIRGWKSRWKETPESSTDPRNPAGPIAFTSAALLGQAYVRLQVDLGPHRALISNDPFQIAQALNSAPAITRSPGLITALLHAAHALSIPIRLGIDFVARTHSFYWSVHHSLSALEYAFLLTRWLLSLPKSGPAGLSKYEHKLFLWITCLMDEADTGLLIPSEGRLELTNDIVMMKQLSVAIVRVWARTFNGNCCWGIVDLVGASLEAYAGLMN
ncbi:hypothetical protein F5884DRAFT_898432 [Xylogone sp. PMI_703]|nr:hypothetical protein F5884DRAFT_898432 [Xylogone sp. PMI_703]